MQCAESPPLGMWRMLADFCRCAADFEAADCVAARSSLWHGRFE